jgi:hypothetical protein
MVRIFFVPSVLINDQRLTGAVQSYDVASDFDSDVDSDMEDPADSEDEESEEENYRPRKKSKP